MRKTCLQAIAASLLLPVIAGCYSGPGVAHYSATAPGVVRGQSPDEAAAFVEGARAGTIQGQPASFGPAAPVGPPPGQYVDAHGDPLRPGFNGYGAPCPPGAFGPGCYGEDCGLPYCAPRQWHRFSYHVPAGLSYPPANSMPAVVQYPYYVHKGPDCFFYGGK